MTKKQSLDMRGRSSGFLVLLMALIFGQQVELRYAEKLSRWLNWVEKLGKRKKFELFKKSSKFFESPDFLIFGVFRHGELEPEGIFFS
jgi:hypothetical protein